MRFSLFALLGLLALVFSASAATLDVEYDFSEPTLEGDDLLEENIDDATAPQEDEDDEGDDDEEEDQEEDLDEDDEPAPAAEDGNNKVDVHLYVPLPPGASLENEFPKWPFAGKDKDGAAKAGAAENKNEDFFDKSVGQFQSKVAAIVSRLKEEKEQLDAKDQKMDAHLAAIKAKIAKAQREIAELEKEDAANRAAGVDAAREKALRDKMRSHPILSKLYAARKFTIELKRMVRALKTMDPESPQYAETMGKIQSDLKQAKEDGTGITDIDDMVAVGASISFIEVDKVRDDEIAGLNGVLCAMMKHIQGEINKWEAKIRADHEAELAAAGGSHDERLRAARAALAEGQLALANYKAKMQREHMEIKAKLRQINAELTQLGAIDGHVSKYRRTRVATAEASSEQKAEGAAAPAAEEKPAWW